MRDSLYQGTGFIAPQTVSIVADEPARTLPVPVQMSICLSDALR